MERPFWEVRCPHCGKNVKLAEDMQGRWITPLGGFAVGSVVGAVAGAGIGLASGGLGMTVTISVGLVLGAILGGSGYIFGDKIVDNFTCPSCKVELNMR